MTVFYRAAIFAVCLLAGGALSSAEAGETDFTAVFAGELRLFPNEAKFADQDDSHISPSFFYEPEIVHELNDGQQRLTLKAFGRYDADDDNRTHFDIREANWLYFGDGWNLVVGIDKVFWGVTESRHLVDIINQTDAVEDIDGEDKLGQPMVNLTIGTDFGSFSFFVMSGFRERTFPDDDARLRGAVPIADDATYDSEAEEWAFDGAVRWEYSFDNWDIGLAHFQGTSREPVFRARLDGMGRPELVPHYDRIDQTSIDLQYTEDAWLLKLEALTRGGQGDRFFASVAGFEYTLFQLLGSDADLGLIAEYLYDGRDEVKAPPTLFDNDIFVGARYAFNDVQSTSILGGTVIDLDTATAFLSLEAERRLGDNWKMEVESRLFMNVDDQDLAAAFEEDDFVTMRLSYFY